MTTRPRASTRPHGRGRRSVSCCSLASRPGSSSVHTCQRWCRRFPSLTIQKRDCSGNFRTAARKDRSMTSSTSPSVKSTRHESCLWFDSATQVGVRFRIRRVSLGRRIELARRIRELGRRIEFLQASGAPGEQIEATLLKGEIERVYLEWGLEQVDGLEIDGEAATPDSLIECGPIELAEEILG